MGFQKTVVSHGMRMSAFRRQYFSGIIDSQSFLKIYITFEALINATLLLEGMGCGTFRFRLLYA
jgi:hypothetical protein